MNIEKSGIKLVIEFVKKVFPEVSKRLKIFCLPLRNGNEFLVTQALASINTKKFHCQGGSVYALYPNADRDKCLDFIVAFQTISDYLDNLCDRTGVKDELSFRQLHLSMVDAVDPLRTPSEYYSLFPSRNDGGYLASLVDTCRKCVRDLPGYRLVENSIKKYVRLYIDLQSYKHTREELREESLKSWAGRYESKYPEAEWYEFSAAAGSTLGVFALFAAAFDPNLTEEEVNSVDSAYFPWVCGLHILLDYYIDSREDLASGDLNFTSYYGNLKECEERILYFYRQAARECTKLKYSSFHQTVIRGLIAMYLSDPKALWGFNRLASRNILKCSSYEANIYYSLCRILRLSKAL